MATEKLILKNDLIQVDVERKTGLLTVSDVKGNLLWSHDPWEANPGILVLEDRSIKKEVSIRLCDSETVDVRRLEGGKNVIALRFSGPIISDDEAVFRLEIELELAHDEAELRVSVNDLVVGSPWKFKDLIYPLRSFCIRSEDQEGYMALPFLQGCIVPCKVIQTDYRAQYHPGTVGLNVRLPYHTAYSSGAGLSMPWYGIKFRERAVVCILETPDDVKLDFHNQWAGDRGEHFRILGGSPVWMPSMGELRYPRRIRYNFLVNGDYVSMAKVYRKHAQEVGDYKSLRQKLAENPNVEKALGAVYITFGQLGVLDNNYDWPAVVDVVTDLNEMGVKKAIISPRTPKLNYNGIYNYTPRGDLDVMRKACELTESLGYVFMPFDEYNLVFDDAPGWQGPGITVKDENGQPVRSAVFSPGTRGYFACTKTVLDRARTKLADTERICGSYSGRFVDALVGLPLRECHDPEHPVTRTEDWHGRVEVLDYMHKKGLLIYTEGGQSWTARVCTSLVGGNGTNYGVPVPLMNLVYHDSVISQWHSFWSYNMSHSMPLGAPQPMTQSAESAYGLVYAIKFLRDVLYGNSPSFGFFKPSDYWDFREQIKEVTEVMTELHERVALEDLISHRFLTDNMRVQETVFSSGINVQVNFGHKSYNDEKGFELPSLGYRVAGPDLNISGKFDFKLNPAT